uniref:Uncharacterized protein n=1 Tax=Ciona intestinalis TaxID=7719 RepID=H2XQF9_CIOIN
MRSINYKKTSVLRNRVIFCAVGYCLLQRSGNTNT